MHIKTDMCLRTVVLTITMVEVEKHKKLLSVVIRESFKEEVEQCCTLVKSSRWQATAYRHTTLFLQTEFYRNTAVSIIFIVLRLFSC